MITLRPYQTIGLDILTTTKHQRPLVSWATGLGKTILFAEWARDQSKGRTLVLAHRDELIQQAVEKVTMVAPELTTGVVKAEQNNGGADVVVASVQTLARLPRLRALRREAELTRPFAKVVVDEAHHSEADSYQMILSALGCFSAGGPQMLGVTATPARADAKPLGRTWDAVVHEMSILEGIRHGYLADLRALTVHTKTDYNLFQKKGKDYNAEQVESLMLAAQAPEDIADAIHRHALTRKCLVFTPGVASAHATAKACSRLGFDAEAIDGTLNEAERRDILRRFKRGKTQVLTNCNLLLEGYDEESITCVVMARPTRSWGLYVQMVGRGTRTYPGKDDCLILDVVGVAHRHDLMTMTRMFDGQIDPALLEDATKRTVMEARIATERQTKKDPTRGKLGFETTDVWGARPFAWVKSDLGYVLSLGKQEGWLALSATAKGWQAWIHSGRDEKVLLDAKLLGYAQGAAEDYARKTGSDILCRKNATWRRKAATEGQRRMLWSWKIPWVDEMTSGEAADAITQAMANARAKVLSRRRSAYE